MLEQSKYETVTGNPTVNWTTHKDPRGCDERETLQLTEAKERKNMPEKSSNMRSSWGWKKVYEQWYHKQWRNIT